MSISPEFRELGNFAGHRRMMKAPEKSNFSQTCNLLSQYMKEKGTMSFGDIAFGTPITPRDSGKSPAMDLFPQHTGFGTVTEEVPVAKNTDLSEMKPSMKPKPKQMTIIYAGKVLVFDDISEEKVKELMALATNGGLDLQKITTIAPNVTPSVTNSMNEESVQRPIPRAHLSGLPIARKASLHRFLEKRKDRINARAPYQVNNSSAATTTTKPMETKTWLGLASNSSTGLRL